MKNQRAKKTQPPKLCKANSCPLPIAFVTDWEVNQDDKRIRKPKYGVCEYHRVSPFEEWTRVTRAILMNLDAVLAVKHIHRIRDIIYKPKRDELITDWLTRCEGDLRRTILDRGDAQSADQNFLKLLRDLGQT